MNKTVATVRDALRFAAGRRARRVIAGCALGLAAMLVVAGFTVISHAQRQVAPPAEMKHLRDNVYWMTGGGAGANTAYVIGDNGVIALDSFEFQQTAKDVLDALAKVTPKPITHFLFTHTNPDHYKGVFAFPRNLTIIAHEQSALRLESILHYERDSERRFFLPTHTFRDRAKLKLQGVDVELYHWAPAHTNGDLIAFFPAQKFAFVGDLASGTNVHLEDYGSSAGAIESLKGAIALDADVYIGGHREPLTKSQMQEIVTDMEQKRNKIVQLFQAGKSLADAEKEMGEVYQPPTPGRTMNLQQMFRRNWETPNIPGLQQFHPFRGMTFTEIVYTELTWAKNPNWIYEQPLRPRR
jgi:glyoxylase-like metal-dependent hydrolase (beta-lactamase superfamily II)